MPAIPAIGAAWAAIGAYTVGSIAVGVIVQGAIIGAAIGGLTAAVTGGNIGKGMLFGAIGGAVMGGIGAWANAGTTATAMTPANLEAAAAAQGTTVSGGSAAVNLLKTGTEKTVGSGILGGQGTGAALVTTGGQMLMGAFDDSGEVAAAEADKARAHSKELAQLQADTQLKIAQMQGKSGSSSSDAAKYSADLQLLNAREQRQQDYKIKSEEWSMLEDARNRRRAAVEGVKFQEAQEPAAPQPGPVAPGVMNPVAAQPIPYAPAQQGMLQQPQEVPVGQ